LKKVGDKMIERKLPKIEEILATLLKNQFCDHSDFQNSKKYWCNHPEINALISDPILICDG